MALFGAVELLLAGMDARPRPSALPTGRSHGWRRVGALLPCCCTAIGLLGALPWRGLGFFVCASYPQAESLLLALMLLKLFLLSGSRNLAVVRVTGAHQQQIPCAINNRFRADQQQIPCRSTTDPVRRPQISNNTAGINGVVGIACKSLYQHGGA